jgi:hypothetical protein
LRSTYAIVCIAKDVAMMDIAIDPKAALDTGSPLLMRVMTKFAWMKAAGSASKKVCAVALDKGRG